MPSQIVHKYGSLRIDENSRLATFLLKDLTLRALLLHLCISRFCVCVCFSCGSQVDDFMGASVEESNAPRPTTITSNPHSDAALLVEYLKEIVSNARVKMSSRRRLPRPCRTLDVHLALLKLSRMHRIASYCEVVHLSSLRSAVTLVAFPYHAMSNRR